MAELSEEHRDLLTRLGGDFARCLGPVLPRIVEVLQRGEGTATFSAAAKFTVDKNGDMEVTLTPREHVPSEPIVRKVSLHGDQLVLFIGAPAEPVPTPERPTTGRPIKPLAGTPPAGETSGEVLARFGIDSATAVKIIKACGERDGTVDEWLAHLAQNGIPIAEAIDQLLS